MLILNRFGTKYFEANEKNLVNAQAHRMTTQSKALAYHQTQTLRLNIDDNLRIH